MRKFLISLSAYAMMLAAGVAFAGDVQANGVKVKTRLEHLGGTPLVIVISTLPTEITEITCEKWVMLGVGSWKQQNEFTIPSADKGVAIAAMNAKGFDGYCSKPGSIIAHTDDGDFVGHLDKGDGNWKDSTKLTFEPKSVD
jgi:hypothetical protein